MNEQFFPFHETISNFCKNQLADHIGWPADDAL